MSDFEQHERTARILQWLADGHNRLLALAELALRGPDERAVLRLERLPNDASHLLQSTRYTCRLCTFQTRIFGPTEHGASFGAYQEHVLEHCERWLTEHAYLVPGRSDDASIIADALVEAFSALGGEANALGETLADC